MKNMVKNFSNLDIPDQMRAEFDKIIPAGIEVFRKSNNISKEEACKIFEDKLQNISFELYDPEKLDINNQVDRELMYVSGLTRVTIEDTEDLNTKISRKIYMNSSQVGTNNFTSTLMHELFHAALADSQLSSRNISNVYNTGCHEVVFENEEVISDKGHMFHEAQVAKMQKRFCEKIGIKFEEKGIFSSGYAREVKILEQVEDILGTELQPKQTLQNLKMIHGDIIEDIAVSMDNRDYTKSEEILSRMIDSQIHNPNKGLLHKTKMVAKKIKNKIFNRNSKDKQQLMALDTMAQDKQDNAFIQKLQSSVKEVSDYNDIGRADKQRVKEKDIII